MSDSRRQLMADLHALLMGAIVRANLTQEEAWTIGLGLLVDIIANAIDPSTPETVADALEESVAEKVSALRLPHSAVRLRVVQ